MASIEFSNRRDARLVAAAAGILTSSRADAASARMRKRPVERVNVDESTEYDDLRADMGIIGTIIVGFIVGVLARYFFPGVVPLGFWLTVALGIGGSVVGGVFGSLIWRTPDGKFHPAGWILSIIGAMAIIWAYNNFVR